MDPVPWCRIKCAHRWAGRVIWNPLTLSRRIPPRLPFNSLPAGLRSAWRRGDRGGGGLRRDGRTHGEGIVDTWVLHEGSRRCLHTGVSRDKDGKHGESIQNRVCVGTMRPWWHELRRIRNDKLGSRKAGKISARWQSMEVWNGAEKKIHFNTQNLMDASSKATFE